MALFYVNIIKFLLLKMDVINNNKLNIIVLSVISITNGYSFYFLNKNNKLNRLKIRAKKLK